MPIDMQLLVGVSSRTDKGHTSRFVKRTNPCFGESTLNSMAHAETLVNVNEIVNVGMSVTSTTPLPQTQPQSRQHTLCNNNNDSIGACQRDTFVVPTRMLLKVGRKF